MPVEACAQQNPVLVTPVVPLPATEPQETIELDSTIWWNGRELCRAPTKDDGHEALLITIAAVFATIIGFMGFFASPIWGAITLIPGVSLATFVALKMLLSPNPEDMKKALEDVLGGEGAFEMLPTVTSEERSERIPNPLPAHPIFIFKHLDQGAWERDHPGQGYPAGQPATYRTKVVFSYQLVEENRRVIDIYDIEGGGGSREEPLEADSAIRLRYCYEIKRETALLLKELTARGSCGFNPSNPTQRAEVRLTGNS